ncbi:MAG: hypothetical protein KDC05_09915 [Bacteroidales bacterium]|nr:hypothetical protein [Bacteroidales bacterium]
MMKKRVGNLLLIAGTGKNSGKTTLACGLISHFSNQLQIFALKISTHKHTPADKELLLVANNNYSIYEEKSALKEKDSNRMLNAGAFRSFYLECKNENLPDAFDHFLTLIPLAKPIIVESPALYHFIEPGVFMIADHPGVALKKQEIIDLTETNLVIDINKDTLPDLYDSLRFKNNEWLFV